MQNESSELVEETSATVDAKTVATPGAQAPVEELAGDQSSLTAQSESPTETQTTAQLHGQAHVQNKGWISEKVVGDNRIVLGTTGQSLRMEAFTLSLPSTDLDGTIRYESHVQNEGWQKDARTNGQVSGSTGQSRHVEAIRIALTGSLSDAYDLWYRVHVATVGWLDWTKDAVDAGSTGRSLPIEAIEVKLQKKGEAAPGPTTKPTLDKLASSISGDGVLDLYLKNIIETNTGTGPDALRKAFDYTVNHYKFKHYEPTPVFDEDWKEWTIKTARELVERGEGNCYRFTGLFVWLARALGYDCTPYIGWVKSGVSGFSIHSWAEIKTPAGVRVYDPDMQRFITQRSFFDMQYATAPVYYYDSFQRELT